MQELHDQVAQASDRAQQPNHSKLPQYTGQLDQPVGLLVAAVP
jgi:CBS domain containing-hemolysin-like protein